MYQIRQTDIIVVVVVVGTRPNIMKPNSDYWDKPLHAQKATGEE